MSVDLVGETIGSYRIVRQIGAGGMGQVYLAEHRRLNRKAAIKVLSGELANRPDLLDRFFLEARATSLIDHPGIVQVFDCEVDPSGRPYIVMEYLAGDTLSAALVRRGPLPPRTIARIARSIAEALAAAHEKGIIHRDLKPDNIFVQTDPPDSIKLVDFGIAKLAGDFHASRANQTHAGALMGTPLYMSPEQCRDSGRIDYSADLYSLGCVMFEMMAGHPPFQYSGLAELVVAHLTEQPVDLRTINPSVPAALADLTAALLRKTPAERPASARDVANRLAAFGAEMTTVPEPPSRTGDLSRSEPSPRTESRTGDVSPSETLSRTESRTGDVSPSATRGSTWERTPGSPTPRPVDTTFGVAASEVVPGVQSVTRTRARRRLLLAGAAFAGIAFGVGAFAWNRGAPNQMNGLVTSAPMLPAGLAPTENSPDHVAKSSDSASGSAAPSARVPNPPEGNAVGSSRAGRDRSVGGREKMIARGSAAATAPNSRAPIAMNVDPPTSGSTKVPAPGEAPAGTAISGLWEGPWVDSEKQQQGTLRLQIGGDGAVAGWMYNKVANQTFPLAGKMAAGDKLDLVCRCPAAQNFVVRGTMRGGGPGELKVRLALSTNAGVFGQSQAVLRQTSTASARTPIASADADKPAASKKWAEILPGSWFQFEPSPTLYVFRANGTGARTTYASGTQAVGQPFPFNWLVQADRLVLRFPSGWADVITLDAYSQARGMLNRTSSRGWGHAPWFGCTSGKMPADIARQACP